MTAAASAASRQWARPVRMTPRNDRSVPPRRSELYGRAFSHRWTFSGVFSRSINRRSRGVNSSREGVPELIEHLGGRPVTAVVDTGNTPVRVDDRGPKIVGNGPILFVNDIDPK